MYLYSPNTRPWNYRRVGESPTHTAASFLGPHKPKSRYGRIHEHGQAGESSLPLPVATRSTGRPTFSIVIAQ